MTDSLTEDLDELARELDRDHVFHSWSAQAQPSPLVDRERPRLPGLGPLRARVPRLLEPARERQHRAPAPGRRRRRSGAGRAADHHRAVDREPRPRRGREAHRRRARRRASTRSSSPTAAPTPTRTRSGWRACTPARQGPLDVPLVPRQHRRGGRRDRRLAARAQRVRPRPRALLRPLPLPLGVLGDDARGGVRARAAPPAPGHRGRGAVVDRGDPARDHPRHGRAS